MRVGLITGTGGYRWAALEGAEKRSVETEFGTVALTAGTVAGVEVVHLCRHGDGHARLSNQVAHRANVRAMLDAGVDVLVSTTVCGAVDPALELGSLVVFDDLWFPSNRLPDGSLCTWHTTPGAPGRGHWIFDRPFAEPVRRVLVEAGRDLTGRLYPSGCYGQVDGPRFNTRAEIAALSTAGVTAVSQTVGPEAVLAGEAELPMAAVGYLTDYANGVAAEPEPLDALAGRLAGAQDAFDALLARALPRVAALGRIDPVGIVYRFD